MYLSLHNYIPQADCTKPFIIKQCCGWMG